MGLLYEVVVVVCVCVCDGGVRWSGGAGRVAWWRATQCTVLGYRSSEIVGMAMWCAIWEYEYVVLLSGVSLMDRYYDPEL
jgi:hypothetical protein